MSYTLNANIYKKEFSQVDNTKNIKTLKLYKRPLKRQGSVHVAK